VLSLDSNRRRGADSRARLDSWQSNPGKRPSGALRRAKNSNSPYNQG
jgi:hypothetical protein